MSIIKQFRNTSSFMSFVVIVVTVATAVVAMLILAPPAGSTPGKVINVGSEVRRAVPAQYHIETGAIPSRIDRSIAAWNCCRIVARISSQNPGISDSSRTHRAKEPQYQPTRDRYRGELMLQIGVVLALGYVAFLAIWIWATRLRPR
jgi:hypothetical protein